MCKYCEGSEYISERDEFTRNEVYRGIAITITDNILNVEAVEEVGYPSRDSTYIEKNIQINYCPMCGKKLGGIVC